MSIESVRPSSVQHMPGNKKTLQEQKLHTAACLPECTWGAAGKRSQKMCLFVRWQNRFGARAYKIDNRQIPTFFLRTLSFQSAHVVEVYFFRALNEGLVPFLVQWPNMYIRPGFAENATPCLSGTLVLRLRPIFIAAFITQECLHCWLPYEIIITFCVDETFCVHQTFFSSLDQALVLST